MYLFIIAQYSSNMCLKDRVYRPCLEGTKVTRERNCGISGAL